jgi:type III pantothenate kinase
VGFYCDDSFRFRFYHPTVEKSEKLLNSLLDEPIPHAVVCSVVPWMTEKWVQLLKKLTKKVFVLKYREELGIEVNYVEPKKLGTDRIANALYVRDWVGEDSIVVDIGTAITVDAISGEGRFMGGAILPGILSSLDCLVREAAQLTETKPLLWGKPPGRSTRECIAYGLLWGTVGAVEEITKRLKQSLNWRKTKLILTGGGSSLLYPLLEDWEWNPTVTLCGLLSYLKQQKR